MTQQHSARGFTLLETLIATGVLVTAIAGLAQLFALSVRFVRDAGQSSAALVAAQDKLESLRSLRLSYDDEGNAVTDPRLAASPPASLSENAASFVDWLDESGRSVTERGAAFVRRWRISEVSSADPAAIAIDVCVFDARRLNHELIHAAACLATVRVRQP